MDKTFWGIILEEFKKVHFTNLFLCVCLVITIVLGIKYFRNTKLHIYFLCYAIVGLVPFVIFSFVGFYISHLILRQTFYEVINLIFCLVELYAFYYFFSKILKNRRVKSFLKNAIWAYLVLVLIFFACIFMGLLSIYHIQYISYQVNVLELFGLLFCCLVYFYELLLADGGYEKTIEWGPSFRIVTGLFLYCILSLPFFLIARNLMEFNLEFFHFMYSIHYVSITFLFLWIAKGFYARQF